MVEQPAAQLSLGFEQLDGISLFIQIVLQRQWLDSDAWSNLPIPAGGNPVPAEYNNIRAGYLAMPVGPIHVTIGRQQVSIGPHPFDSLMVSDRTPFLDAVATRLSSGPLEMTWLISTLENGIAQPDVEPVVNPLYGFDTNTIFYNIHHFQWNWPRLNIGIGSQILVAREMNNFHLGDFFPVFSWHNADIIPNNMCLVGDVVFRPYDGSQLFVQYGFDDIDGSIFGWVDSEVPTICGLIVGGSHRLPWLNGRVEAVGGYTHYLWGNFDEEQFLARAIYRLEADGSRKSMPLTSPYGPGAAWLDAAIGASVGRFRAETRYLAVGLKPGVDLYSTPYETSTSIEGIRRAWTHHLCALIGYSIPRLAEVIVAPGLEMARGENPMFTLEVSGSIGYRLATVAGE
jgi:hypothetical protein